MRSTRLGLLVLIPGKSFAGASATDGAQCAARKQPHKWDAEGFMSQCDVLL